MKPQVRPERENVIPLINVVFLLLIFFMIAGQISRPEMLDVMAPSVQAEADIAGMEDRLLVNADGKVALSDKEIPLENITTALIAKDGKTLLVKIDKNCTRNCFLPVLRALQKAGHKSVRLITVQT
ncbi:biopolymer transporter ExbD [Kordiimonas sp. SCSIO 12603]|uniref:ExbD/TolR family protein n=1 Tax=Kordiimonas sp. SCSIO 12603 TaxID=2829596 RepID=UPI002104559B|nr:biopolymer transporter ExbD [Kordiimonas sp. SCSIO 12603]UTW58792.1 biopolymer transporter ExbD [Kordiimonas sp. SCSIO 12603]